MYSQLIVFYKMYDKNQCAKVWTGIILFKINA